MKRFFLALLTSLSFLSMNCYGNTTNYLEQVLFDLVVNEDLFSHADENKQIVSSSDYIYSVDQALESFTRNYNSLQPYNKVELLGVIQIMLTSGLIELSNTNNGYYPAYNDQSTLEILMTGLANDQERLTHLIEEINKFIITNLSQFPHGQYSHTVNEDADAMMALNNYLTQLNLDPLLIIKSSFLNNLYQAFRNVEPLLGQYAQELMLFELDLTAAGLYKYNSDVLPPTGLIPTFQSATELQPLIVNLITGPNKLFFTHMNSHLQVGINSINGS